MGSYGENIYRAQTQSAWLVKAFYFFFQILFFAASSSHSFRLLDLALGSPCICCLTGLFSKVCAVCCCGFFTWSVQKGPERFQERPFTKLICFSTDCSILVYEVSVCLLCHLGASLCPLGLQIWSLVSQLSNSQVYLPCSVLGQHTD